MFFFLLKIIFLIFLFLLKMPSIMFSFTKLEENVFLYFKNPLLFLKIKNLK